MTKQLEARLYDHYGWDPFWGGSHFGGDAVVTRPSGRPVPAEVAEGRAEGLDAPPGDPHLGSAADIKGCAVHAADGDLGPVEHVPRPTTSPGTSAISSSPRITGCRASSCSLRPMR